MVTDIILDGENRFSISTAPKLKQNRPTAKISKTSSHFLVHPNVLSLHKDERKSRTISIDSAQTSPFLNIENQ